MASIAGFDMRALPPSLASHFPTDFPTSIIVLNSSVNSPVYTAAQELQKGFQGTLHRDIDMVNSTKYHSHPPSIVIGTVDAYTKALGTGNHWDDLNEDGFWLHTSKDSVQVIAQNKRGRASIFFENGVVVANLTRAAEYARLLASIGLNAMVVSNVDITSSHFTPEIVQGLGRIADVLGRMVFSLRNITNQLYKAVPYIASYLVKADSEGQPGPLVYNHTLSPGANLFANALKPHGGILMFHAFVYHQLNKSDREADRANAAVEFFKDLKGVFEDNIIIQIKYGPIDFQLREPASPLFINLLITNTAAIELEISQEYLGQQCHLVYLPPLWKTILDFDLRINSKPSRVSDIISGERFNRSLGGFADVVNVGTNTTWLGSHLAISNLYAYGRLAWSPARDPVDIIQD